MMRLECNNNAPKKSFYILVETKIKTTYRNGKDKYMGAGKAQMHYPSPSQIPKIPSMEIAQQFNIE